MDSFLAKKLKDAGYPTPTGSDEEWDTYPPVHPSLSGLIQACQPYFWGLVCNPTISRGEEIIQAGGWTADARVDNISSIGMTAEEAVANLYLSLRKNEQG